MLSQNAEMGSRFEYVVAQCQSDRRVTLANSLSVLPELVVRTVIYETKAYELKDPAMTVNMVLTEAYV